MGPGSGSVIRHRLKSTALVSFAGLVACIAAAAPLQALPIRKSHATIVIDAIDKFIVPHVDRLKTTSAHLAKAMETVCTSAGDESARKAAVTAFGETVRAWGALDFVRFGPVTRAHRLERILFWPDPRATAQRQLSAIIAARKPGLLAPGALASQSVAVQGLTALEILLFDDKAPLGVGTDETAVYRCQLAHAVADSIAAVAGELSAEWSGEGGFRLKMLTAGSDNALYKDASETARDVVKALAMGLELCRDRFLLPELTALAASPPKRARLPFDRAELMGAYLSASLAALHELFEATGLAAYSPADKPWMSEFLPRAWKSLLTDAATLDALREGQRGSEAHLHALRKMRFDIGGIRSIVVRELATNAEIDMGFNELDGD